VSEGPYSVWPPTGASRGFKKSSKMRFYVCCVKVILPTFRSHDARNEVSSKLLIFKNLGVFNSIKKKIDKLIVSDKIKRNFWRLQNSVFKNSIIKNSCWSHTKFSIRKFRLITSILMRDFYLVMITWFDGRSNFPCQRCPNRIRNFFSKIQVFFWAICFGHTNFFA